MAATMTTALAVFVRTPELSAVKTRLAANIGTPAARQAYKDSLTILTAMIKKATMTDATLTAYWAVAEEEAVHHPRWSALPTLWTGAGELGDRLANVYNTLYAKHRRVILMGSDSPQITPATISEAAHKIGQTVIGPATDGGFYLFAADTPILADVWRQTPYSCPETLAVLTQHLADDNIHYLPPLADMDDRASLLQVIVQLDAHDAEAAEQLRKAL